MKSVKEIINSRREDLRKLRSSSWINLIIRILILIFIIMIIRYFRDSNPDKFRSWDSLKKSSVLETQEDR